jgi:hypothetical protein
MSNAFGPLAAVGVTTSTGTVNLAGPRITSDWSEPATATTLALVPGRERRALFHVPREEWTAVHVQVLCWRILTWWAVGVVLHESVLPLLVTGDPEALPTAITVIGAGFWVNDRLRRRLH